MSKINLEEKRDYELPNGVKTGEYYVKNGRMVYTKRNGERVTVTSTPLTDFNIIDNGVRNDIYEFEFANGVSIKGTFKYIVNKLKHNTISGIGNLGHDFISKIILNNQDRVKHEVNGGYTSLDDIEYCTPSDVEKLEEIISFIDDNFSNELKQAFKLLCLLPFHWIIKTDSNTVNRGLIKGLSVYGVAGAGKSLICLIALNMFEKDIIQTPTTYSTVAGFINDIHNHVGIIIADDCNELFIKDSKRMDDLNKNIINIEVPSKTSSDGETVKHYNFTSTPVYTSNDRPDFKTATLDRIDVINCVEASNIPNFPLGNYKNALLLLGRVLASTFKENYKDIVATQDNVKASNLLLERSPLDWRGIQTASCPTKPTDNNTPLNVLFRQYLSKRAGRQLNEHNIEEALIKYMPLQKFYYKEKKDKSGFYVNMNEFCNFIRRLTDDTSRELKKEIKTLHMTRSSVRNNGKTESAYLIEYKDIVEWVQGVTTV